MFIERNAISTLEKWLSTARKPLVIRGARQVGKTALVRYVAEKRQLNLIEINFERRPELCHAFRTNDPQESLRTLASLLNIKIDPHHSLLFLDEIQAFPEMLSKLRWFAEEMPELPVIAAGSLLEFMLANYNFSMPVGRISYMYLEPLSFEEFLDATDESLIKHFIVEYQLGNEIPSLIHEKLLKLIKEYSLIGGMPAAVAAWAQTRSFDHVHQIHHELLSTYYDDFSKYAGTIPALRLQQILTATPMKLGEKCIYKHFDPDISSVQIKHAIALLTKAKLIYPVYHTSANGIPLGAEVNRKYFKLIFIDIGLASTTLDLKFNMLNADQNFEAINQGGLSEQFVGQVLRTLDPYYMEPKLYYWLREEKGSNAEIDYLLQHSHRILPIEVKSGSTGSLKSLHLFMSLKKLNLAIRICSEPLSLTSIQFKLHDGSPVDYQLLTIPFYLTGQLHRLIEARAC